MLTWTNRPRYQFRECDVGARQYRLIFFTLKRMIAYFFYVAISPFGPPNRYRDMDKPPMSDIDKRSRAPADRPRFALGLARYVDFLTVY